MLTKPEGRGATGDLRKRALSVLSIGMHRGGLLTVNMENGKVYNAPVVAKPLRSNDRRVYTFRHAD
jgi:hypothetical protein